MSLFVAGTVIKTKETMPDPSKGYRLTLPVPPRLNHRIALYRGRFIKSMKDRHYQELVQQKCMIQRFRPIEGDVLVNVVWYRKQKRGDIDGILKGLFDSLKGFFYKDDSQIAEMTVVRDDSDRFNSRIEIECFPLTK